nr:hypothetical protein [Mesorhizobium sp. B2-3-5]
MGGYAGPYPQRRAILNGLIDCARRLVGLPVLFVGVRCHHGAGRPARRAELCIRYSERIPVHLPVCLWEEAVSRPGVYELEVDTSFLNSVQCAEMRSVSNF